MSKLLVGLLLAVTATSAFADRDDHGRGYGYRGGYGYHEHYHGGYNNWIAPALIGGVIGYELGQPRTVYVQPQPQVIYQQPPVIYNNSVQGACPAPYTPTYNLVWAYDANGNQYQQQQFVGCR